MPVNRTPRGHTVRRRVRRRRASRPNNAPKWIAAALLAFVGLFLTANVALGAASVVAAVAAADAYFANLNLPDPNGITEREIPRTTKIYDRNGVLLNETYDTDIGKRTTVHIDQISDYVKWATIATEDADFYENT